MQILKDKRGRSYVRYADGSVSFASSEVAKARGERSQAPRKTPSGDACKTVAAVTLRGRPAIDVCNEDLIPVAAALIDALFARSEATQPATAIIRAAEDAVDADCCAEGDAAMGTELAIVVMQEAIRRRLSPADWLRLMPPELAIVSGTEGADPAESDVAEGITAIWQRLTGGISGAAIGGRAGPVGSVVGALIGSLFPELARGASNLLSGEVPTTSTGEIDLNPPGEQLRLIQGEERGAADRRLASNQSQSKGANAFIGLGPVQFGVGGVDLDRLLG